MKPLLLIVVLVAAAIMWAAPIVQANNAGEHQQRDFTLVAFSLIEPLGITTLSCVTTTFLTGIFRRKLGRRFLKIHLPLAIASLALGATHATMVVLVS